MPHKLLSFLIFNLFLSVNLFSQNSDLSVDSLIRKANTYLYENKSGAISYSWRAKPVLTTKEYKSKVQLFYDKKNSNNSIGDFILILSGKTYQIFLDDQLYLTDTIGKTVECQIMDSLEYAGVEQFLKSKCKRLFLPFVRNTEQPMTIASSTSLSIQEANVNNRNSTLLNAADSNESLTVSCSIDFFDLVLFVENAVDSSELTSNRGK